MGLLTKVAIVATFTVALIAIIVAATTINSPQGNLTDGATYTISWTGAPSGSTGSIGYCTASDSSNCTTIAQNLNLSSQTSYPWKIDAPPGTYVLFINDGGGNAFSSQFTVVGRGGSSPTSSGGSSSNSTGSASPTESSEATGSSGSTGGAPATTVGNTGATNSPTGTSGSNPPASTKSGASTLRSSLLGLFVGLGVVASVMIQLF